MTATPPGAGLARTLATTGTLTDPLWHRAVLATDRSAFLPETIYGPDPAHPGWECPITPTDPRWDRWVAGDFALVTQVDDGEPVSEDGRGRLPTSSISQPSLVLRMLQALDAREGHRVLEIGTGTGYNTALLCHALGEDSVVSVEIDPGLAETAVKNLAQAGHHPTVVAADAAGTPEVGEDEFDRVLSTVAARGEVPFPWVDRSAKYGIIVTPFEVGNTPGVLLRLRVHEDGTATGHFMGDAPFMVLRSQRPSSHRVRELVDEGAPGVRDGHTEVNPRVVAYRNQGWQLTLGHLVPDLRYAIYEAAEERPEWAGEATVYVATPDGSWALGEYTPEGSPYETRQDGSRDLWAEIAAAWDEWTRFGSPGRDRLGVTVDQGGTHLWVDAPAGVLDPKQRRRPC
ncbi:methyltransferase domain-containing protein [Nocardiopsis metallicus]|uniref:Protein-L-isoaspartate O-methyltransferase n=1 Tax=Nocardiopsis metallicus TaxID=179819 RepID=A0A840WFA9_9ACTN|nr:methyltransferase domain-containing protein [Nocardiopsis metallicus]MBB5494794.1 protein-L-isoaspartate(D-aspartate) O-methyltransferase [Nocardiopsis metallicus]